MLSLTSLTGAILFCGATMRFFSRSKTTTNDTLCHKNSRTPLISNYSPRKHTRYETNEPPLTDILVDRGPAERAQLTKSYKKRSLASLITPSGLTGCVAGDGNVAVLLWIFLLELRHRLCQGLMYSGIPPTLFLLASFRFSRRASYMLQSAVHVILRTGVDGRVLLRGCVVVFAAGRGQRHGGARGGGSHVWKMSPSELKTAGFIFVYRLAHFSRRTYQFSRRQQQEHTAHMLASKYRN